MVDNNLDLDFDKTQSLEEWITEVTEPIVDAIGFISESLEALYQELM